LEQSGFEIVSQKAFPVIYGARKLTGQLAVCTQKMKMKGAGKTISSPQRLVCSMSKPSSIRDPH